MSIERGPQNIPEQRAPSPDSGLRRTLIVIHPAPPSQRTSSPFQPTVVPPESDDQREPTPEQPHGRHRLSGRSWRHRVEHSLRSLPLWLRTVLLLASLLTGTAAIAVGIVLSGQLLLATLGLRSRSRRHTMHLVPPAPVSRPEPVLIEPARPMRWRVLARRPA